MGIQTSRYQLGLTSLSSATSLTSSPLTTPKAPPDADLQYLETFIIVWYSPSIENSEISQTVKDHLHQHVTAIVSFHDPRSCEQWLKRRPTNDKILLILNGDYKRLLANTHQLASVVFIYIICAESEAQHICNPIYSKLRKIVFQPNQLLSEIIKDTDYFENVETSRDIQIFLYAQGPIDSLNPELAVILWYQLFMESLLSPVALSDAPDSSYELIQLLRQYNSKETSHLNLIKEFQQNYHASQALQWLSNDRPSGRILAKALREQNIAMLFHFQFFLKDIHNQLSDYQLSSVCAYKKHVFSSKMIQDLKDDKTALIVFDGFLFASLEKPSVSPSDINDHDYKTILLEIHADYEDGTPPFSQINQPCGINYDENPVERIIFMCGCIFQVISFKEHADGTTIVRLSLIGDRQFPILKDHKEKLRRNRNLSMITDILRLANLNEKAEIYSQQLSKHSSLNLYPCRLSTVQSCQCMQTIHDDSASLSEVQFIVFGLRLHLTELARAMLDVLRLCMLSAIIISEDASNIDFDAFCDKTIIIFSTSQNIHSLTKLLNQPTQKYLLYDDSNRIDRSTRFDDIEDLINELCQQLLRYFRDEATYYLRRGDTERAKTKTSIIDRTEVQLKNVWAHFSEISYEDEKPIDLNITIAVIKAPGHELDLDVIRNLFGKIVLKILEFFDPHECQLELLTTECRSTVFVFMYSNIPESIAFGLKELPNVKTIYRYDESSLIDAVIVHPKSIYFKLAHSLFEHYATLCAEYRRAKNLEKLAQAQSILRTLQHILFP